MKKYSSIFYSLIYIALYFAIYLTSYSNIMLSMSSGIDNRIVSLEKAITLSDLAQVQAILTHRSSSQLYERCKKKYYVLACDIASFRKRLLVENEIKGSSLISILTGINNKERLCAAGGIAMILYSIFGISPEFMGWKFNVCLSGISLLLVAKATNSRRLLYQYNNALQIKLLLFDSNSII